MKVLSHATWSPRAEAHRERARTWTAPHLARRDAGVKHPVEDFLFEYYDQSPARLERWHPGLGVGLEDAPEYAALGAYTTTDGVTTADPARLERRLPGLRWTRELLSRTAERPPRLGCFGLHEWAMLYRTDAPRHPQVPLRLGASGTAAVVDSHRLACTHVDAYRFFTEAARPLNETTLTRDDQLQLEQPGCLHVSMDLYRIAYRLAPFVESTIVLDTFELAHAVRQIDMRASPYDLSDHGLEPIRVEEPGGKAEYVRHQRALTERAAPLRARLLRSVDDLLRLAA